MPVAPRDVTVSASERDFPPGRRLHTPAEYAAAFAHRQVLRGPCFDLHCGAMRAGGAARLGLVIPKKLAKAAVLRNSIKRQLREAFRMRAGELPPRDLVFRLVRWPENMRRLARGGPEMRRQLRAEAEALMVRSLGARPA